MLEKKMTKDIRTVNCVMAAEGMQSSDQGKDVMRNVLTDCTSFENSFDNIIEAGKKEGAKMFPIFKK